MSLYDANDRAMRACEAAYLRDPRDGDEPDEETDAAPMCRACGGDGYRDETVCYRCNGAGVLEGLS